MTKKEAKEVEKALKTWKRKLKQTLCDYISAMSSEDYMQVEVNNDPINTGSSPEGWKMYIANPYNDFTLKMTIHALGAKVRALKEGREKRRARRQSKNEVLQSQVKAQLGALHRRHD
jgi:hypothetical protein